MAADAMVAVKKPKKKGLVITDQIAKRIATAADRYVGIHVLPSDGKWAVRKTGATRAYGLYTDKRQALKVAREKRKNFAVSYVFVHNDTGGIVQIIDK